MVPTLLEFGPLPFRAFGLMVALALLAGGLRLGLSLARYGLNPGLAERYVTAAGISGLLGARIWYIGEHWSELSGDLIGALTASAGFTFYGGFIIAAATIYILARRDGTDLSKLCDSLGPALALGYAIGRVGCQLSGDGDYGIATDSWWGMSYLTGVVPTLPGELVYPTPLFESAASLFMLWILTRVEQTAHVVARPFQRFGLYLVLLSIERFFIEFLRVNPPVWNGFSEAQLIAVGLMVAGGVLIAVGQSRTPIEIQT